MKLPLSSLTPIFSAITEEAVRRIQGLAITYCTYGLHTKLLGLKIKMMIFAGAADTPFATIAVPLPRT